MADITLLYEPIEWTQWASARRGWLKGPVAIVGPMGAGKTTAVKHWLKVFESTDPGSSPTFTLIHQYESPSGPIFHADFYRLNDESEAEALGLTEYLDGGQPFWMEWPEKIPNLLPPETTVVHIEPQADGARKVTLIQPA
ncbi:MAG TPA: tRNA (adenosine(37)-N6)-threonylcarbamoyltransferase complex ATPase subunit type 1 TsaE [Cryomorphaceae bacterium]|jgi:tRNA threonylcarbamoyladenosine biosynthesis protein TsaE|nr:MAG: hypothetical protein ABR98_02810 [Cryomorphaceae bacterium BACL7 MAG-120910-bin2]KRO84115.1 MAG: hypothetical protein ABR87_06130 [Cryomorphaceae bacterium BACL7 MAG-121220-bin83]NQW24822.1 tRNA (adenosine(37)-N6)-threonylcarbamoyltransferase complex ATPase subunit type 1 TsaE [Cryomorphaceae bacterium]HAB32182.1 tRNA (adenosine(37)-N6)-threonylcarbamoyltransferase complex ATPase subunit type 1 TsaE [Cryomorphaceae bacterium]